MFTPPSNSTLRLQMNCKLFAALMLIAAFLIPQLVKAQPVFESGISDSTLFDTVTNLPADQTSLTGYISPPFPNFRQVNLQAGGSIGDVSSATDASRSTSTVGVSGMTSQFFSVLRSIWLAGVSAITLYRLYPRSTSVVAASAVTSKRLQARSISSAQSFYSTMCP